MKSQRSGSRGRSKEEEEDQEKGQEEGRKCHINADQGGDTQAKARPSVGGGRLQRDTPHAGGAQADAGWGGGWAVSTEGGEPRGRLSAQERQDLPGEDLKYREQRKTVGIGRSRGNQGTWCAKS